MITTELLNKIKTHKIGNTPMVVLPLKIWEEIEDKLENLEILKSKKLKKKISNARSEKKSYSSAEIKKILSF